MNARAEFVLARIAEDEAWAARWVDAPPSGSLDIVDQCDCNEDHAYASYLAISPARVLAECEVKRRIVEALGHHADHPAQDAMINAEMYASEIVGLLAVPYADHPDFREEWRQPV